MTSPDGRGFLYWPGFATLRRSGRLVIFFTGFFYLFYGGAAWLVDFIPWRFDVGFAWERNTPFLPATALVYTSISWLMLLALFVIRAERELRCLLRVLCLQTVIGALFFILLPVSNIYPPRYTGEELPLVFLVADTLNLHNNELPSLHVCFAFTTAAVLAHYAGRWQALLLYGWATVIAASAMTIHEHTLPDVAGGMLLAAWGVRYWHRLIQRTATGVAAASEDGDFRLGRAPVEGESLRSVQRNLLDAGAVNDAPQPGTKS